MRTLTSLTILSIAGALTAQAPTFEAATNVGVFARSANAVSYKFAPKGTQVSRPVTVTAAVTGADATTVASTRTVLLGIGATVQERGNLLRMGSLVGTSASSDPQRFQQEPHSFLLKVPARKGAKAKLSVAFKGQITGRAGTASGAVDINGDGRPDFSAIADGNPHTKSFELTAGDRGFHVMLTTNATAALNFMGPASYVAQLDVILTPAGGGGNRCTFTPYGTSCGPQLSGVERTDPTGTTVTMKVVRAQPGAAGVLMLGLQRLQAQIPRTRCFLHLVPLILVPHRIDAQGQAAIPFPVPKDFAGTVLFQEGTLLPNAGLVTIQTSNGVALTCKKGG